MRGNCLEFFHALSFILSYLFYTQKIQAQIQVVDSKYFSDCCQGHSECSLIPQRDTPTLATMYHTHTQALYKQQPHVGFMKF